MRVYYFGHDSSSFCIKVIDLVFIKNSSQIYLPYDILGIFILFVLDPNKKIIYILDPLPRPTWGVHILKNMDICNKLNIAIRLANPEWNDDISKWGRKVPIIPTNSHRYEFFHLNITLLIFSTLGVTFHMNAALCLVI